jgi:hypothetical protein
MLISPALLHGTPFSVSGMKILLNSRAQFQNRHSLAGPFLSNPPLTLYLLLLLSEMTSMSTLLIEVRIALKLNEMSTYM